MSAPTAPNIVRRPDPQNTKIDLFWYPPSSDGDGSGISSYTLFCSNPSLSQSYGPSDRIASFNNLSNGTTYAFQIYATNSNSLSGPSASFIPVQPGTIPNPPPVSSISYSTLTSTAVLVYWSTPTFTGNADLRHYAVWAYPSDEYGNILSNVPDFTVKNYVYSNVNSRLLYLSTPLSNYRVTVRSINDPGWSIDNPNNYITLTFATPVFNPSLIPGITQWLDASSITNFTLINPSTITAWRNSIGNFNSTTAVTGTPFYSTVSSYGAVFFNGSSRFDIPRVVDTNWSIFVVARTSQASSAGTQWHQGNGVYDMEVAGNTNDFGTAITAGRWTVGTGSNTDSSVNSSTIVNNGVPFLGEFTRNSVNGGFSNYTNGFLDAFVTSGPTGTRTAASRMTIGSLQTNTQFFNGFIHEIVAFSTLLTDYDRQRVEGYLAWKWGIQTSLPRTHPFFISSPSITQSTFTFTFSPSTLSTLELWLDSSDSNTITLSGTSVNAWNDKSPFSKITGISATKPILSTNAINSRNSIIFNSASNTVVSSILSSSVGTGDIAIFAIWKPVGATTQAMFGVGGLASSAPLGMGWNGSGTFNIFDFGVSGSDFTSPSGSWVLQTGFRQINQLQTLVNGYFANPATDTTNFTNLPLTVGGGAGFLGNGEVGEVLFYKNFVSQFQRQRIEGYLAWKWGLQSNLTPVHPYFYSPPPSTFSTFVPTQLPALDLWIDGTDPLGTGRPPANATTLTSVFNEAFKFSTTQTNASYTPSFSSSTIFFSTNTYLNANQNSMNSTSNYSLFIVANPHSLSNCFFVKQHNGVNTYTILTRSFTTNSGGAATAATAGFLYFKPGNAGPVVSSGTAIAPSTLVLLEMHFDSNRILMASNGFALVASNGAFGLPNVTNATNLTIGNWDSGSINVPSNRLLLNEFIFYNSTLSMFERERMEGHLAWKWGLQSNLPSTHLFRASPPTFLTSSVSITFSPSSLTSMSLWLDATQITGLSNTQVMTSWVDKSPNALSNASSNSPTYVTNAFNGLPAVRFNGTNQFFNFGNVLNIGTNPGISIFSIVKYNNSNDGTILAKSLYGPGTGRYAILRLSLYSPNYMTFLINNTTNTSTELNYTDSTSGDKLVSGVWNKSFYSFYSNATLMTSTTNTDTGNMSNSYNFFVGAYNDGTGLGPQANTYFNGDMGEILVYLTPLTPFDRQKVEGYLSWKWGLAHKLPITHPFFYSPPGSNSVFSLTSLPSLSLWLDATDPLNTGSAPADGTSISTWSDKSGRGFNGTAVNTVPTYSTGISSIVFAANSYYNTSYTASFNSPSDETLFVVYNSLDNQSRNFLIGTNTSGGRELFFKTQSNALMGVNSFQAEVAYSATNSVVNNEFAIATMQIRSNNWTLWVNGGSNGATVANTLTSGRTTRIGNSHWSSNAVNFFSEVISFNGALSGDDRQTVEGYLAWKWNLQGRLPLSHPYKFINPLINYTSSNIVPQGLLIRFDATSYSGSGAWSNLGALGANFNASIETGTPSKNAANNGIVLNGSTNFSFSNPSLGNAWTLSVWFKRTGTPTGTNAAVLTDEFNPGSSVVGAFIVNNYQSGTNTSLTGGFFNQGYFTGPNVTFTTNEWHVFTVSWDGATMRTYYDGTLSNATNYTATSVSSGSNFRIGREWSYLTPDYVVGEIGQVLIYNRALFSNEVLQNYRATSTIFSV